MGALEIFTKLPWKEDTLTREQKWQRKQEQARTIERLWKAVYIGIPTTFLLALLSAVFIFDVDILQVIQANFITILKFFMTIVLGCFSLLLITVACLFFMTPYFNLKTNQYSTKDEALQESAISYGAAIAILIGIAIAYSKWMEILDM